MRTRRTDGQTRVTSEDGSAIAIIRAFLLQMSHLQLSLVTDRPDKCSGVFPTLYKQLLGLYVTVSAIVKLYVRDFDLSP